LWTTEEAVISNIIAIVVGFLLKLQEIPVVILFKLQATFVSEGDPIQEDFKISSSCNDEFK
jgi:hypothetical protein